MSDTTICGARLFEVAVPLRVPFTISGGTLDRRRSIIVELRDQDGQLGYGEAAPFELPFYSAETISSVKSHLQEVLLSRVVGSTFANSQSLHSRLTSGIRGNRMARAAVDTAWWDLQSRSRGQSLSHLIEERLADLGVPEFLRTPSSTVSCGAAIGIPANEDVALLRQEIEAAIDRGFTRLKLKVRPGWGAKPIRVAQQVLEDRGIALPIWVDGNGAYRIHEHEADLRELDDGAVLFIEQPFDEECLWDAVQWSRHARTPICLDESLVSDDVARQVIDMQGPTIWNLKVQRLGGIEETCRVYARAVSARVRLWIGTMPETGLGAQAALAFAAFPGCVFASDVGPSDWWFAPGADLIEVSMDDNGQIAVPTGPAELPRLDHL